MKKNKVQNGALNHNALLTDEIVIEARRRAKRGERIVDLAREFGVHSQGMGKAINGQTWTHLDGVEEPATTLGNRAGRSKLLDEQVIEARRRTKAGASRSSLAVEYGVSLGALNQAVNGTTFVHLDSVEPPIPKTSPRNRQTRDWGFRRNF